MIFFKYLLFSVLLLNGGVLGAGTLTQTKHGSTWDLYADERANFKQARKERTEGNQQKYQELKRKVKGYPIAHYLDYEDLRIALASSKKASDQQKIQIFFKNTKDDALTRKLYRKLLQSLAKNNLWSEYVSVNEFGRYGAVCDVLLAKVQTHQQRKYDSRTRKMWSKGRKHGENCKKAFTLLEKNDRITVSMVWSRVYALVDKGNRSEVKKLLGYLSTNDRKPIKAWLDAYPKPAKTLPKVINALHSDTILNRHLIVNLLNRWAKRDAQTAYDYWQKLKIRYAFSTDARVSIDRLIARMAAYDGLLLAHQWLHDIPDSEADKKTRVWRVRTALRALHWSVVIKDIQALSPTQKESNQWQYWLARAYEKTGKQSAASFIYQELSKELSYYGFLAADRLGRNYAIKDKQVNVNQAKKATLAKNNTLIMAREYKYAGLAWEGRREWASVVDSLKKESRIAAAALALDWKWFDRSLFTINNTDNKGALSYRFPMPYTEEVKGASKATALDSEWVYAVMRRESGFIEDIRSHAGATGLMQLMPATAKEVARRMGQKHAGDLTQASNNIKLGSSYLRFVLNKFNNNLPLATAAYNAGPTRVKRWLPSEYSLASDVWVDTIPYTETRRYVRAVMAYMAIFEWRSTQHVTSLSKRMPEVKVKSLFVKKPQVKGKPAV